MKELEGINRLFDPILKKYQLVDFKVPEGGLTINDSNDNFFDLKKPIKLKYDKFNNDTHQECVKRVVMSITMLDKIIENNQEDQLIIRIAKKFEEETGCTNYTFARPDGNDPIRLLEESHGVEIRIYGYKHKGE